MNAKKTIIIISIVVGVVALGLGIYFAWNKAQKALVPASNQQPTTNNQQLLSATEPKLKILSKNGAFDYWIANSTSTKSIFYISNNGNIFKINGDREEIISNDLIENLQLIKVSPDNKMVLIKSGRQGTFHINIFNSEKNIWQPALLGISVADFSPDGKKIAYLTNSDLKQADLMIKDLVNAKQKPEKIISINQQDFDLKWIENNAILLVPKPSFDFSSEIWKINIKTKTLLKLMSDKGMMVGWSKFGDLGLKFSAAANNSYNFSLIDNSGVDKAAFKFLTFPDKCLISGPSQIYCAVPRNQDVFSRLVFPDDYLKRGVYFQDGIYQIDLAQNKFQTLFQEESPLIDAVNLKISGNRLLFINRYDNRLYSLAIQ